MDGQSDQPTRRDSRWNRRVPERNMKQTESKGEECRRRIKKNQDKNKYRSNGEEISMKGCLAIAKGFFVLHL